MNSMYEDYEFENRINNLAWTISGNYNEEINVYYGVKDDIAVFDVASCVGFLVNDHLDLWHASTFGIGKVLKEIMPYMWW